jgi:hypothetical protein
MRIREHHGFSHGVAAGTTEDMNCDSCQLEKAAGQSPVITDSNSSSTDSPQEVTNEKLDEELCKLADAGVLDFVLPTDPLGEAWIIGVRGEMLRLSSKGEVIALIAGIAAATHFIHNRNTRPLFESAFDPG